MKKKIRSAAILLFAAAALLCACQRPVRPVPVTQAPASATKAPGKAATLPPGVTPAAPDKTATQDTKGAETALPEEDTTNSNSPE